ncbi:MAG: tetratricopeptide repeat protein [Saprospiraceae bacterium]|nr:tetratricopeptide repeat protein [Saprospiraceae bacterium]
MKKTLFFLLFIPHFFWAQGNKSITPLPPPPSGGQGGGAVRAVVVGISDYQDPAIPDLRFADRDAEAFANFLRSPAGGSLDADHLKVLLNSEATTAQFDAALGWLIDESDPGDQAIIYFSGHGDVETKTRSQQGFLLCWDSPPQSYISGAYPIFFLKEVVTTLSLENKARAIVITDACRSGKLAGNSIGGAQLTSQNLAQQFANEIKILSCQPNEYSLEGEQWGGGRGAFSFHLVDGLYGLADGNGDGSVNLMELSRHLEDHVTPEVSPQSQVPMTLGNRIEKLANVYPDILAQVKKNKDGQALIFSSTDSKGIEDEVLATVDSTIRALYHRFKNALKEKVFLEPPGECADAYYLRLMAEPKLERLHNAMRRNYAAALQDDAQQAVNNLMKMEPTETRLYRLERLKKYAPYPRLLGRAAELLGPEHYMYTTLRGRKCYFEGWILYMESGVNPDSLLGRRILNKYKESLTWQSDVAQTYLAMSQVFTRIAPNRDSMLWYSQKVIDLAPSWPRAFLNMAMILGNSEETREHLDRALAIDSSETMTWLTYGYLHFWQKNYEKCIQNCLKAILLDSNYAAPYALLGATYFELNRIEDSEKYFLKGTRTENPGPNIFFRLGSLYYNAERFEEAEKCYKQGLAIEPKELLTLIWLASIYMKTQRVEEAKALLIDAMKYDSTSTVSMINLANAFEENGFFPEAEIALKKALSLNPKNALAYRFLGDVYLKTNRIEEAKENFEKAITLFPKAPNSLCGMAVVFIRKKDIPKALEYLQQSFEQGFSNFKLLKNGPDFVPLHDMPEFKALLKKYFPDQVND